MGLSSELLDGIRGEFLDMPGLKITTAQACRLWNLNAPHCCEVLDVLVGEGFLIRTPSGAFIALPSAARPVKVAIAERHESWRCPHCQHLNSIAAAESKPLATARDNIQVLSMCKSGQTIGGFYMTLPCMSSSLKSASSVTQDRGEQTPRTLILADRRIAVVEVLDAWLAPDHRYFKLKGEDGDTYLVRHDERRGLWELTMFRTERTDASR
jgi:hypothetical protein